MRGRLLEVFLHRLDLTDLGLLVDMLVDEIQDRLLLGLKVLEEIVLTLLVPVDDFYEKIGSPPYSLAVLGVLKIQRIGFVILYLSRRAESVSAVRV